MTDMKVFVPTIYIKDGQIVKNAEDFTVLSTDILQYSFSFFEKGADALIVRLLSKSEEETKNDYAALLLMCELCPLEIWGSSMSDIIDTKLLLDAGCKKVIVDLAKLKEDIFILSNEYGRDKFVALIGSNTQYEGQADFIKDNFGLIILNYSHELKSLMNSTVLPVIASIPDVSLDKIIELLKYDQLYGLSGAAINSNIDELSEIKLFCIENDILVRVLSPEIKWDDLKKNSDGMVPVIVQDYKTGEVLMCAYMNQESYNLTFKRRRMTYYSRSRNELWLKGDTSGHYQYVTQLWADCDLDTILAKVYQVGAACHTGSYSCFFNRLDKKES